ncbi:phosphoribosyltransferase family protein [Arthrobacter sp. HMWF013]|uniref:phosphoribosyltransferase family protein n=1 Tax=Arthrobacter sp. HMWF013 TaxID=2056849 RepID=UPI000D3C29E6|nr:phosphoribosyltransferase family protein [Arthrobacter sp. HMWF013]PTT61377.1 phosphoribosyl transferase [Arthrobacter sp. HMWF013]
MFEFQDRTDAGRKLGERLVELRGQDVVVLGLPRGGVPVAFGVAEILGAPLDVIVVRKLGVPFQPEFAMGAIGEGNARLVDPRVVSSTGVNDASLEAVERRERELLESRVVRYRQGRAPADLTGRTALIVDDGIATGSTARVACMVARQRGAARVILAVPVASGRALASLAGPDDVVCLVRAWNFRAVGNYYRDFSPTGDEEVMQLLEAAARPVQPVPADIPTATGWKAIDEDVEIPSTDARLRGNLHVPVPCPAMVVFAHGSGSGRRSPRNRQVAAVLQKAGLGTLLLDLLTPAEEANRENVFDVGLLAARLTAATQWLSTREDTASSLVGYFGASTGAGAALWAAAEPGAQVRAVVSRGGRPDLAGPRLAAVRAPTLLIVGSDDPHVLALNRQALTRLGAPARLEVVRGATHLFEEPGTLTQVAALAAEWFVRYLLPTVNGQASSLVSGA